MRGYIKGLRECIRNHIVANYVMESPHMKKFFDYIQLPNFDIAVDAATIFKELMARHKSTVVEFFSNNYEWFFINITPSYWNLPIILQGDKL